MADTYTLADLMEEQRTLGARPALPDVTPRDMRTAPLGQSNLVHRALSSFGQGAVTATQEGIEGRRTPAEVARTYLTEGPMGPLGAVRVPSPIRAYHGSPHDFDEFRMDRIGTGEGAQAYGHGLYFAENEGVARGYRNRLTNAPTTPDGLHAFINGTPLASQWNGEAEAIKRIAPILEQFGGDRAAALKHINDVLARRSAEFRAANTRSDSLWPFNKPSTSELDALRTARDNASSEARVLQQAIDGNYEIGVGAPGRMYEVNLHARPEQFLDWDRPLSGQSEAVRAAMSRSAGRELPLDLNGQNAWERVWTASAPAMREAGDAASRTLAEQGIPGIRYLDQGSRSGGQGTSNYVVFNPEIIEILRKYGIIAPPVGAGAASLSGEPQP